MPKPKAVLQAERWTSLALLAAKIGRFTNDRKDVAPSEADACEFNLGGVLERGRIPRFIVLQRDTTDDAIFCYTSSQREQLKCILAHLIDDASAGEDSGWVIEHVWDLDTGKALKYRVTVTLTEEE